MSPDELKSRNAGSEEGFQSAQKEGKAKKPRASDPPVFEVKFEDPEKKSLVSKPKPPHDAGMYPCFKIVEAIDAETSSDQTIPWPLLILGLFYILLLAAYCTVDIMSGNRPAPTESDSAGEVAIDTTEGPSAPDLSELFQQKMREAFQEQSFLESKSPPPADNRQAPDNPRQVKPGSRLPDSPAPEVDALPVGDNGRTREPAVDIDQSPAPLAGPLPEMEATDTVPRPGNVLKSGERVRLVASGDRWGGIAWIAHTRVTCDTAIKRMSSAEFARNIQLRNILGTPVGSRAKVLEVSGESAHILLEENGLFGWCPIVLLEGVGE